MDLILLLIFAGTLFVTFLPFFKKLKKQYEFQQVINKLPGPKSYPFLGTTLPYITKPREDRFNLDVQYGKQYGPIYRMWHGRTFPEIRLMTCDYAEEIFKSSKHIEKSYTYKLLEPWLGQGLISSTGQHWFMHRRLLTPTFHFSILENFCDVFYEHSELIVKKLEELTADGKPVNIYPIIGHAALDIICETAMGFKINALEKTENEYVKAVYSFSEIAMHRFYKPWLRVDYFFRKSSYADKYEKSLNTLQEMTTKVIKERKLSRQMDNNEFSGKAENDFGMKKRKAFLDLLLDGNESNKELTDEDIKDEVNTFMFAVNTTSVGICWALYMIGLHEDVQEKIWEEMKAIFGDDNKKPATYRELNEMKYLERVLKECLRLYPSVPNISRKMNEDIELGGYTIPKNAIVALQIFFIHRDERFFKDPEKFDPDRFLPENMEGRNSYAFVPFAAGPRNCIGQRFALLEEKSVVSTIVRNFKIKSIEKREDIKLLRELVLRPVNGINLKLEKRR
ncbi:CLUMA_CG001389, isoform A [Clunio marinus]|uniref:CLUMA_CG001389, isoform A n=1 Tax=Clunio marinus TaxID=568069 RepID=A0A1J1HHS9_9DIPT|nr:CLUMA_CG001389, isoform A [Clunio marinus]